jgi:hypothetical protein
MKKQQDAAKAEMVIFRRKMKAANYKNRNYFTK